MQWEYRVFRELPESELNEIGGEGWEIIRAEFDEEDETLLVDVLAKRGKGGGRGGRGGGRGGRGRRRGGQRIGVMGGTSIDDNPGF